MKWSIVSEVRETTKKDNVQVCICSVSMPHASTTLQSIKCYAVAQIITKPFSIYPIEFCVVNRDITICWYDVAVPNQELVLCLSDSDLYLRSSDVYIISCEMKVDLKISGGECFEIYAKPLFQHIVAPHAFCVFSGD